MWLSTKLKENPSQSLVLGNKSSRVHLKPFTLKALHTGGGGFMLVAQESCGNHHWRPLPRTASIWATQVLWTSQARKVSYLWPENVDLTQKLLISMWRFSKGQMTKMRESQTKECWRDTVKARLQTALNHCLKHGNMHSLHSLIYWGSSAFSTQPQWQGEGAWRKLLILEMNVRHWCTSHTSASSKLNTSTEASPWLL